MFVIRALGTADSSAWMFVSKETGSPFTTQSRKARLFKTYEGAERAMKKLKTARHWMFVGNNCEVSKFAG